MKKALFFLVALGLFAFCDSALAQKKRSSSRISLSPRKIHKLPKVDLVMLDKTVPRSYLYRVDRSNVTLINRAVHAKTFKPQYIQGKVGLDKIKDMTIYDRKRRFKTNLYGAAIGGALGYIVGKSVAREDFSQVSIEILNQQPTTGFMEPIIGTILGASIGIAIGDQFTPIRLNDVYKQPQKSSLFLRGVMKKKKKKRKR